MIVAVDLPFVGGIPSFDTMVVPGWFKEAAQPRFFLRNKPTDLVTTTIVLILLKSRIRVMLSQTAITSQSIWWIHQVFSIIFFMIQLLKNDVLDVLELFKTV